MKLTGWILALLMLVYAVWMHISLTLLEIRLSFAKEQIAIFTQMANDARTADVPEATRALDSIVGYYPSGTKQETGSRLDAIVEMSRNLAIRCTITRLRELTGEDRGDAPEQWLPPRW